MSDDMIERVWRAMGKAIADGSAHLPDSGRYDGGYVPEGSSIYELDGRIDLAVLARVAIDAALSHKEPVE